MGRLFQVLILLLVVNISFAEEELLTAPYGESENGVPLCV